MKIHQICFVIVLSGLVFISAAKASLGNLSEVSAFARIPVDAYARTEFDFMTEIKTSAEIERVIVDCQSFINGIMFKEKNDDGDWTTSYQFALSEAQCEEVTKFVTSSVDSSKAACIELDLSTNRYELSRKTSDCR